MTSTPASDFAEIEAIEARHAKAEKELVVVYDNGDRRYFTFSRQEAHEAHEDRSRLLTLLRSAHERIKELTCTHIFARPNADGSASCPDCGGLLPDCLPPTAFPKDAENERLKSENEFFADEVTRLNERVKELERAHEASI